MPADSKNVFIEHFRGFRKEKGKQNEVLGQKGKLYFEVSAYSTLLGLSLNHTGTLRMGQIRYQPKQMLYTYPMVLGCWNTAGRVQSVGNYAITNI